MSKEQDFMSEAYAREQREANAIDAENALGRAWQEQVAGNPGFSQLSDAEQDAAADRFFQREREASRLSSGTIIRPEQPTAANEDRETAIATLKTLSHGPEKAEPPIYRPKQIER